MNQQHAIINHAIDSNHNHDNDHDFDHDPSTISSFITDVHSPPTPGQRGLPGSRLHTRLPNLPAAIAGGVSARCSAGQLCRDESGPEEDWPGRLVAQERVINWRHRVTTIVRQRVSKNTFQTAGTAKTPGGQLQTQWDRLTLPVVYPVGYNLRDVDLRSRLWLLCRRLLLQVHPLPHHW